MSDSVEMKALRAIRGKKLLWVGFDAADELYDLVFEDNLVIRVPEFFSVPGADYIQKIVATKLEDAKNTVALCELVKIGDLVKAIELPTPEVYVHLDGVQNAQLVEMKTPEEEFDEDVDAALAVVPEGALDVQRQEETRPDASAPQCEQAGAPQAAGEPRASVDAGVDAGAGQSGKDAGAGLDLSPAG